MYTYGTYLPRTWNWFLKNEWDSEWPRRRGLSLSLLHTERTILRSPRWIYHTYINYNKWIHSPAPTLAVYRAASSRRTNTTGIHRRDLPIARSLAGSLPRCPVDQAEHRQLTRHKRRRAALCTVLPRDTRTTYKKFFTETSDNFSHFVWISTCTFLYRCLNF